MKQDRERRVAEKRVDVQQRVRESLMRRLGPSCAHMSPQEFETLVQRAAEIQLKYELRRMAAFVGADGGAESAARVPKILFDQPANASGGN